MSKPPKRASEPGGTGADQAAGLAGRRKAGQKTGQKTGEKTGQKVGQKGAKPDAAPKKRSVKRVPAPDPADLSKATAGVLDRLFTVVTSRRDADPDISHSARLLSRGTPKVAQKFGEEAVECLIEAVRGNSGKLINESADVLYHLIVLWVDAGVNPGEVWSELQRRAGTSGIAEKASRPAPRRDGG